MLQPFLQRLLCFVVVLVWAGSAPAAEELRVSAASSLADALKEIHAGFERETGIKVKLSLGASSLLARQIGEGAPADVFFSADLAQMDALERKGLIRAETRRPLLSNALVVVVLKDSPLTVASLAELARPEFRRVATGNPAAVPVGVYAREALERLGGWERVKGKIVAASNARTALAAVESGNAEAGIVYKTDAAVSAKVEVLHEVPEADAPEIVYPAAVTRNAKNPAAAEKYLSYMEASSAARAVFGRFGFGAPPGKAE